MEAKDSGFWLRDFQELGASEGPRLEQEGPMEIGLLREQFEKDRDGADGKYLGKSVELTGIAVRIGPDISGAHVLQLSDRPEGRCLAVAWCADPDQLRRVPIGTRIRCRGNIALYHSALGFVVIRCRILEIEA